MSLPFIKALIVPSQVSATLPFVFHQILVKNLTIFLTGGSPYCQWSSDLPHLPPELHAAVGAERPHADGAHEPVGQKVEAELRRGHERRRLRWRVSRRRIICWRWLKKHSSEKLDKRETKSLNGKHYAKPKCSQLRSTKPKVEPLDTNFLWEKCWERDRRWCYLLLTGPTRVTSFTVDHKLLPRVAPSSRNRTTAPKLTWVVYTFHSSIENLCCCLSLEYQFGKVNWVF